jgi:GT2 family glycosyltransferase
MKYFLKRALRIVRFFIGWRGVVVVAAFLLALIAITSEKGAAWYLAAATLLVLVLLGTIGTRTNEVHTGLQSVKRQLDCALAEAKASESRRQNPVPVARPDVQAAEVDVIEERGPGHRRTSETPDVSVVVAAFNEREYIFDCLESIRAQSWHNFECIVVDDESTDDTLELAFERFSDDPRFRFVTIRRNSGLSAARNVGTEAARAEWITFLDGDDYLYQEALERRLEALAPHMSNHWVAGAYCSWAPVPQDEPLRRRGEDRPARPRISWLDALHDAPFIASAPIVRTTVIRAMGGFRNVEAAEDADMWTKVLRHGYVFVPTRYTGIAYRQKANSMFRRESIEHAVVTVGLYESNYQPKPAKQFVTGTPFHYTEPAPTYVLAAQSFRRNLIALTTAVAQEDEEAIRTFTALIDIESSPYLPWVVDVDQIVRQAARRCESYDLDGIATRTEILISRARALIDPKLDAQRTLPIPTHLAPVQSPEVPSWAPVRDRQRIHLPAHELGTAIHRHIVMTPSAAYHVDELGPMAVELAKRGIPVAFMVSDRRWEWTEAGLRSWDFPVYAFPESTDWTGQIAGIMALNDWGEEPHVAIVAANERGVPTFAKVEGVQDFNDIDVPRVRNPYRTVRHVLCQGRNDAKALADTADTYIVGNSRLEAIWNSPGRRPAGDLIVVNLNFTWGVLEEARSMWIDTVVAATKQLSHPTVFSLHPAEKTSPEGVDVSDLPMRHLLTRASVLVSRFSTVPFEAMARGVPFVYHNPHHEAVPTFHDPKGAFEITESAGELAAAIDKAREWAGRYRDKSEAFFRDQIDIDPQTPSAARSAEVIERLIERS